MRSTIVILAAACAVLACAGAASADPGCPDCQKPVPSKHDCGFESVKTGVVTKNATGVSQDEACVSNSHAKHGMWITFRVCLEGLVNSVAGKIGAWAHADGFASQDGVHARVKAHAPVEGGDVDSTKVPVVGHADDATWQATAKLRGQGVDTPRDWNVGGDTLPHVWQHHCVTGC